MRYEIPFMWHSSRSAKTKGIIPQHLNFRALDDRLQSYWEWLIVDVAGDKYSSASDDKAYVIVVKRLASRDDTRPIAGRSYVRCWRAGDVSINNGPIPYNKLPRFKQGDRVVLHAAFHGMTGDGGHRLGVVNEVLGEAHYGLQLDDYPGIVDFTIREFACYDA
jgi:hypothetical protein